MPNPCSEKGPIVAELILLWLSILRLIAANPTRLQPTLNALYLHLGVLKVTKLAVLLQLTPLCHADARLKVPQPAAKPIGGVAHRDSARALPN